jgi:trimeric autotransporter adhesin
MSMGYSRKTSFRETSHLHFNREIAMSIKYRGLLVAVALLAAGVSQSVSAQSIYAPGSPPPPGGPGQQCPLSNADGQVILIGLGCIRAAYDISSDRYLSAGSGVIANGRVQNVSAGIAPTDAVNMQQFWGDHQQMLDNRRVASIGTADAMAAASIPALEPGKSFGVGLGTGSYDGRQAVAIAAALRVNSLMQVRLNFSSGSDGKAAAGAGAMMSW